MQRAPVSVTLAVLAKVPCLTWRVIAVALVVISTVAIPYVTISTVAVTYVARASIAAPDIAVITWPAKLGAITIRECRVTCLSLTI
jgi:hypothetical protein